MSARLFNSPGIMIIAALSLLLALFAMLDPAELAGAEADRRQVPVNSLAPQPILQTYPYADHAAMVNRSMFRPIVSVPPPAPKQAVMVPPVVVQQPAVDTSLPFEVKGIVITPDSKLVMLYDEFTSLSHLVGERDILNSWAVVSIDKKRVILKHDSGDEKEIVLNQDEAGADELY